MDDAKIVQLYWDRNEPVSYTHLDVYKRQEKPYSSLEADTL